MRCCLEDRIKMRVPIRHCVFAWMVEHASWLLTVRQTQSDGITPYKRLKGRSFATPMLAFGEECHYKVPQQKKDRALEGKLGAKWRSGIFLGFSRDSNEYGMWDTNAQDIVRARSLQRKPMKSRWISTELMKVNLRPRESLY